MTFANLNPTTVQMLAALLFALAILHTFSIKLFQHLALKFAEGSIAENFFHLLGEVEIIFGLWAAVFLGITAMITSPEDAIEFIDKSDFTEPLFVFAIMVIAATKPLLELSSQAIKAMSRLLPLRPQISFFVSALILGPILGSFITEPAAMAVTAILLKEMYFSQNLSFRFKYFILAVLFVNVSIGGVLTPYAAPPVLMVASTWLWDLKFMATHFGWKASVAIIINTASLAIMFRKELATVDMPTNPKNFAGTPLWLRCLHLFFLIAVVLLAHHPAAFIGVLLFFIGLTSITQEFQSELKLKEGLLVGFFLAGLVILGKQQSWWLEPLLRQMPATPLFLGATALTAITDNAAITYLGSQIPQISENIKYALVAGAISGGGMTVIANAPNPAGFAILKDTFGPEGISPLLLAISALLPTLVAMACLWGLPSI